MINETTYTKEWILKKSNQYVRGKKKADPTLIEKVTKALHLLEELARTIHQLLTVKKAIFY